MYFKQIVNVDKDTSVLAALVKDNIFMLNEFPR